MGNSKIKKKTQTLRVSFITSAGKTVSFIRTKKRSKTRLMKRKWR